MKTHAHRQTDRQTDKQHVSAKSINTLIARKTGRRFKSYLSVNRLHINSKDKHSNAADSKTHAKHTN